MIAKQSTALTVVVGPILDSTGAEYASAVIGDLSISKNGGTLTAMASAATLTYIANGMYTLVTTTGNMDTLGAVQITCNKATYQMPKMERNVVPASVYDAIVTNATNSTGGLPTATAAITGLAGVISTYAGGAVASVTNPVTVGTNNDKTGYALTVAPPTAGTIADAVWDEVLTGATHNIASSAGRRLRQIASSIVYGGTAQGPGTGNNQIQLDTGASATNGAYDPALIAIEAGTGAGQTRLILQYVGSTRTATVDRDWRINPDNTSEFVILGDAGRESVNEGLAQGGTSTSITLNASASSTDDAYNGQLVFIRSGAGQDQVALVEDYVGSTKVATIRTRAANGQWATTPNTTSAYVMIPNLTFTVAEIAAEVGTLQVLTRLDSMIESDGAGQFQFDTIALQMAPAGGGGGGTDWTANERTAIRAILGVPTSGTTPTDPTTGILDEIRDKTALITSGSVQTSIPVTAQGQINGPLYIGDDYLTANGRSFDWIIPLPSGFVAGTSTCKFGMIFEDESGVSQFNLSGTVADVGSGNVRLRFELPRATTGALKAGFHRWSTEIVSATGVEVTAVAYSDRKLVEWREKQT